MSEISQKHPRAESLRLRERISEGFKTGLVIPEGLAAHGRGEAFDYLLGEKTSAAAKEAIDAAVASLLLAKNPVISVNGNVAALVPGEVVELCKITNSKLEVNLFHGSSAREKRISRWLKKHGAREVLGAEKKFSVRIKEIQSDRRKVDSRGIAKADVVLVPLEDGDRTEALKKSGKLVIAIDLNPMSRTARAADITIVDNISRALLLMVKTAKKLSFVERANLKKLAKFDNEKNLQTSFERMLRGLDALKK